MRKTYQILLVMAFCSLGFLGRAYAQDEKIKAVPVTISRADERFSLTDVSFFKRLEKIAATLNISFDLVNNSEKDIKLKVVVVAFKSTDNSQEANRKFIKYPEWRKKDLDKEVKKNIYLDSSPKIDKTAVDSNFKEGNAYPNFDQYVRYVENNPTVGNDVTLLGINTGVANEAGTPDFYVINKAMKSSIVAKLKVPFNRDNIFFNNFGIIILDSEQKKVISSQLYFFDAPFVTR